MAFSKSGVCSVNDLFEFYILHGAIFSSTSGSFGPCYTFLPPFFCLYLVFFSSSSSYVLTVMSLTETLSILSIPCLCFWRRSMAFWL